MLSRTLRPGLLRSRRVFLVASLLLSGAMRPLSFWALHIFLSLRVGCWLPSFGAVCSLVAACITCRLWGPRLGAAVRKAGQGALFVSSLFSLAPDLLFHSRSVVLRQLSARTESFHYMCLPGLQLGRWCLALRWRYCVNISNACWFCPPLAAEIYVLMLLSKIMVGFSTVCSPANMG